MLDYFRPNNDNEQKQTKREQDVAEDLGANRKTSEAAMEHNTEENTIALRSVAEGRSNEPAVTETTVAKKSDGFIMRKVKAMWAKLKAWAVKIFRGAVCLPACLPAGVEVHTRGSFRSFFFFFNRPTGVFAPPFFLALLSFHGVLLKIKR